MSKIAEIRRESRRLHLIISQEHLEAAAVPNAAAGENPHTLYVVQFFHTPRQQLIADREFPSLEEAMKYCQKEYSVSPDGWTDDPLYSLDLTVAYRLTPTGVPQPVMVTPQGGTILFRSSSKDSGDTGNPHQYQLEICGDKNGLKSLAAMLLIASESENFDHEFHWHLERFSIGNTSATIRGLAYPHNFEK